MKVKIMEADEFYWFTLTPESLAEASLIARMALQTQLTAAACYDAGIEGEIEIRRHKPRAQTIRIRSHK